MADVQKSVRDADEQMQQQARKVAERPWVERLARFGYAAKGFVYALVGILAVQSAIGVRGATTDSQGALATVAGQPLGRLLLIFVAIGLVGYVLWRLVQATLDTENKGTEPGGIATRVGYVVSAITYAGLALGAARLAFGSGNADRSSDITAQVMGLPFGRILIALAGLVVIGVGGFQIYRAVSGSFEKELNHGEMSTTEQNWARRSGRVGLSAQGFVFGLTGLFLIIAALRQNPDEAQGIDRALQALAQQPFGPYLLGITALGLVAYGIYSFVEARYRRMMFR